MSEASETSGDPADRPPISFAEFLENIPPSQRTLVVDVAVRKGGHGNAYLELSAPQLYLHCSNDRCNGLRFFRLASGTRTLNPERANHVYMTYICSNCQKTIKLFALQITTGDLFTSSCYCYKFGELPPYGPPTPARLIRLFGHEREMFLKGRRCENQGLGIGAFVYYRRVVESQKDKIFGEIIRVAHKIGAPEDMIRSLEGAKKEAQFSNALASVKDAIPPALLINGHNPLMLLHSALSGGLHAKTDERCLELAHDIRVVLIELADRLGQALKDEAELNTAVNRLLRPKSGE